MLEADLLRRIENKLDKVCEEVSTIKTNQASDLQRFHRFDEIIAEKASRDELRLHAADCKLKGDVSRIEDRVDAVENKAKGARWAGGKIWAAGIGLLVIIDLIFRIFQYAK